MQLTFASYNIHKAIGTDGRRDPERILSVLDELDADIVGLQEVDRRFGARASVFERERLAQLGWQIASVAHKPASLGWHGNMVLVREGLSIGKVMPVRLPRLEPRGALQVEIGVRGANIAVTSMHLDLTGLRRRSQLAYLCASSRATGLPRVMLGDLNEWSPRLSGLGALAASWSVATPGLTFPAKRPILALDRVIHCPRWSCQKMEVWNSALAQRASDHLPIRARLELLA